MKPYNKVNYTIYPSDVAKNLVKQSLENEKLETIDIASPNFVTSSPKINLFEDRIAALHGGAGAFAVKSLNQAHSILFSNLLTEGDNIISYNSKDLLLNYKKEINKLGVQVNLVKDRKLTSLIEKIDSNTKFIYLETFSKEDFFIPDFQKISFIAREFNIPVVVNNTGGHLSHFIKPFSYGATFIIESINVAFLEAELKYKAILIDSGKYNWYNGIFDKAFKLHKNITTNLNPFNLIDYLKYKNNSLYNSGSVPEDALSLIKKIEDTFSLLQERSQHALELAKWLTQQSLVEKVNYIGLPLHESHFTALTFMRNGFGTELSFSVKGNGRTFEIFAARLAQYNYPKVVDVVFDVEQLEIRLSIGNTKLDEVKSVITSALQLTAKTTFEEGNTSEKINHLSKVTEI